MVNVVNNVPFSLLSTKDIKALETDVVYMRDKTEILFDNDKNFLDVNDFEIMLKDSSLVNGMLNKENYYKRYFNSLNWFQLDLPILYYRSLGFFLNYLTYFLIQKVMKEQEYSLYALEKYFTKQVTSYLIIYQQVNDAERIKLIYDYWQNTKNVIESFIEYSKKSKYFVFNSRICFTCNKDQFKIDIPLLVWDKNKTAQCYLFNTYVDKKPNWFTIPALYKIYAYYAEQNVTLSKVHLIRFNLANPIVKPTIESIPLTVNVAEMVRRYKNLSPYPYGNIFDPTNESVFYGFSPLNTLLRDKL